MSGKTPYSEQHASAWRDVLSKVFLAVSSMALGALSLFLYQESDGFTKLRLSGLPDKAVSSVATTANASEPSDLQEIPSKVSVVDDMRETRDNLSGFQQRGRDPAPPRMRESGMYAGEYCLQEEDTTEFSKVLLRGRVEIPRTSELKLWDISRYGYVYIQCESEEQANKFLGRSAPFLVLKENPVGPERPKDEDLFRDNIVNAYDASYIQIKTSYSYSVNFEVLPADPTVVRVSFPGAEAGDIVLISLEPGIDLSVLPSGSGYRGFLFQL